MKHSQTYLVILLAATLLLGACSQTGVYTKGYYRRGYISKPPETTASSPAGTDYYVVQKGETLYSIAWQHGYDHRQLAYWNGINPPYTIFPQQRIRVTPPVVVATPVYPSHKKSSRIYSPPPKPQAEYQPVNEPGENLVWHWPAKGQLISTFSNDDAGRKGVDIAGRLGQPVEAAATGKVVYSGSGLRGYGNLIIVKHNEEFFSAYAHNNKILVKENQNVKAGQKIADMGKSGTDKVQLHFEIRRDGKPVNPLSYLPKHRK